MTRKVLAIVGPTAVGKTDLSIKIAKKFNGEIISGDSMQVYSKLDIGTAKIKPDEMDGIRHYMINVRNIDERFAVADFTAGCRKYIAQIDADHKLPLIVGGTGFYLQALFDNFHLGQDKYDQTEKIRRKWREYLAANGPQKLWNQLNQVDPAAAEKIPVGNSRRVIRALEVYENTGKLFSQQHDQSDNEFDPLIIGLNTDRQLLYQRINKRVDIMMEEGLLREASWLYDQGGQKLPAGKGIGYKEFYPYFEGRISLADAIAEVKKNSRHYAKRQLTWFRNKMNVHWFDLVQHPQQYGEIITLVSQWLGKE